MALAVVGGVATGIDQATSGTTTTTAGDIVNGTAAGGMSVAFGAANPALAAVDAVSSMAGGPSLSEATNNGINSAVTIGEAAVTGDTRGLEELNRRNLSGENGQVTRVAAGYGEAIANGDTSHLEAYQREALRGDHGTVARTLAESGDFWAEHGIGGGLREFGREFMSLFD